MIKRTLAATLAAAAVLPAAASAATTSPGQQPATDWWPGYTCDGTSCQSNEFSVGWLAWTDIDLGCPADYPEATGIILKEGIRLVDIYDNGAADGGHFWVRLRNTTTKTRPTTVRYNCIAEDPDARQGRPAVF